MRVLNLFPPNFREINAAFNVRGKRVIFAYGDVIYNPGRVSISPELLVHESVHGSRQGSDPSTWWRRYIADPEFRLAEEVPAHKAEYAALCECGRPDEFSRIAERLASPLYGSLVSFERASQLLRAA